MSQQQFIHAKCPECGTQMLYKRGGKNALHCRNCGYARDLGRNSNQVKERKMSDSVDLSDFTRGMGAQLHELGCNTCGSLIATVEPDAIESCPFCLGTEFEPSKKHETAILPREIIPFSIPKEIAIKRLKKFFAKGYFLMYPNDMAPTVTDPDNIRGVYIPIFLFDVFTQTTWKGEGAFNYGGKGKALWDNFSGFFENLYENVVVHLTNGVDGGYLGDILPYNTRHTVRYDHEYLKQWVTEIYHGDEKSRFGIADQIIDGRLAGEVYRRIKARETKNVKQTTEKQNITFRHALVPVWISIYEYQGESFPFIVNGQTGKLTGDKPLSWNKIYTVVGLIVLLVLILVFTLG